MSLLTFERPTCGQVIGSTMTRLWLRFYAGSRRINEPATTMNDDDYESRLLLPFRFLQHIAAASIISTTRRSFFSSGGDSTEKREKHTHTTHTRMHTRTRALNTPLTTHQKAFRVSFHCLLCLCFGILPLLLPLLNSAGHFVCFNFGLSSCCFYYYLWPSSDTRELKFKMYQTKTHNHKKGKRRENSTVLRTKRLYSHAPHRARLCTSYNQQSIIKLSLSTTTYPLPQARKWECITTIFS